MKYEKRNVQDNKQPIISNVTLLNLNETIIKFIIYLIQNNVYFNLIIIIFNKQTTFYF